MKCLRTKPHGNLFYTCTNCGGTWPESSRPFCFPKVKDEFNPLKEKLENKVEQIADEEANWTPPSESLSAEDVMGLAKSKQIDKLKII